MIRRNLAEIAKMLDQTTKLVKSEKNHNPMQRTQDTQWQASSSSQQSYPASQLNINGPYRSLSFWRSCHSTEVIVCQLVAADRHDLLFIFTVIKLDASSSFLF